MKKQLSLDEIVGELRARGYSVTFHSADPLTYAVVDKRGGLALRRVGELVYLWKSGRDPYAWLTA